MSAARTLDEILLEHGSPFGPVIAIGDPRDPVPPLGAARIFVPGEGLGWQDVVTGLVRASKVVVMCPNDTEGVKWELDLLAQEADQVRTVYLANPELPADVTTRLMRTIVPGAADADVPAGQHAIAAYRTRSDDWRILTTASPPTVQTYTVALNMALQGTLGHDGSAIDAPVLAAVARAKQKVKLDLIKR